MGAVFRALRGEGGVMSQSGVKNFGGLDDSILTRSMTSRRLRIYLCELPVIASFAAELRLERVIRRGGDSSG